MSVINTGVLLQRAALNKASIRIAIPFFIVILILMLVIFRTEQNIRESAKISELETTLDQAREAVVSEIARARGNTLFLAGLFELSLSNSTPLVTVQEQYEEFVRLNPNYYQLRVLDKKGFEQIRIERDGSIVTVAPAEALQDKSGRYYMSAAHRLKPEQIYRSPLDLNIEKGEIQRPYRPTIRFIAPAVTEETGEITHFLVLNYNVQLIYDRIQALINATSVQFKLINSEGYYLFHSDPNKEWGFMFGNEQNNLKYDAPEVWKAIQGNANAVMPTGVLFEAVCTQASCLNTTEAEDQPWYVIGEIGEHQIQSEVWWIQYWPYAITFLLLLVAVLALKVANRLTNTIDILQEREHSLDKSKKKFQELLNSVPEGVAILDTEQRIEIINPVAEEILGISNKSAHGQTVSSLIDPTLAEQIAIYMNDSFARTRHLELNYEQPFSFIDPNNSEHMLEFIIDIAEIEDEILFILVIRDVTRRTEQQRRLRQSQKLEAMGQLTGGVAHDFNNLLGIIIGNIELLELETVGNEKAQKRLGKILKATHSAADLTQKLLAVSRKKSMQLETIDVNAFMEDIGDMLTRTIKNRIAIRMNIQSDLPALIIDPNELTNALINLTVNARDAMPDGGTIYVRVEEVCFDQVYVDSVTDDIRKGPYVMFDIADTGEGIPEHIIEKVLEPFFTTKEKGKGTGLGLSMVYGLVKQLKGHMRIYSEIGVGTSIHLYFPVVEDKVVGNGHADQPIEMAAPVEALTGARIVVIDDEPDLAEVASEYLTLEGAQCEVFHSADSALSYIQEHSDEIDLVFSDIVMPGKIDGLGLYRLIREQNIPIDVVLSSGFSEEMIIKQHDLDEQLVFVRKPYKRKEMVSAVLRAMANSDNK